MRVEETEYILDRNPTDEHYKLTLPDFLPKDEKAYSREIDLVFCHQKAVCQDENPNEHDINKYARYFYKFCYKKHEILRRHGPIKVTIDEFIYDVILDNSGEQSNELSFLLGKVGVGKTAFINYLFTVLLRKHIESKRLWFLRLDLHGACHGDIRDSDGLCYSLIRKLERVINQNKYLIDGYKKSEIAWQALLQTLDGDCKINKLMKDFKNLVALIDRETGRRLFLVFDNIDFMCHKNDRALFKDDENTGDKPFLINLHKFVGNFMYDGIWGNLGASILFVTRFDSYDIICKTDKTDGYMSRKDLKCFTLEPPKWEEVLSSREELLNFGISLLAKEKKKKKFEDITRIIKDQMDYTPPEPGSLSLASNILELTNYGLRELMQFFSQYAWLGKEEKAGRLIHKYPLGLIGFMLNKWCRYSQMNAYFPNIYLVNIEQRGKDDSREHEHPHSYWLKRMIAALIYKELTYKGPTYISIFTGSKGDGYGEKEVRECLGSLSEANLSNMAIVTRERNPLFSEQLKVKGIELTARGKHCMNHIFDKFFYLQLIVDDYLLPFPRCIRSDFEFDQHRLNYSYIVENDFDRYWT
ncbi:hypothetical protein ACFLRM_06015, partial [Acidobacteriota bacterium]